MKCPSCGAEEIALVKVCNACSEAFVSQDLLELYQLQFLVDETARWQMPENQRLPYTQRLQSLRDRLAHRLPPAPEAAVLPTPVERGEVAVIPEAAAAAPEAIPALGAAVSTLEPIPPRPAAPPKEKVPFDQWLLSERNIKIALYSGGLLLLIAGLIFIGVNWTRIPGPGKFAITLMITGLMYLGGYLLFRNPAYRIGGVALLGVASGFLTLNFAVLQIYIFGPNGLQDEVMWLIASPMCLLLYILTAYWTRNNLFTLISLAALGSTVTAALVVIAAPLLVFILAFALLGLAFLPVAHAFQKSSLAGFTYLPIFKVSHLVSLLAFVAAFYYLLTEAGCKVCSLGNPWLALAAMIAGLVFYILNAYWERKQLYTYFSLAALGFTVLAALVVIGASVLVSILTFALLGLALLFLAHAFQKSSLAGFTYLPIYIVSHLVTLISFVTAFLLLLTEAGCKVCQLGNPWLALSAMVAGLVFYILGVYWERKQVFTYASLSGLIAVIWGILTLINVLILAYLVVYALLALGFILLAKALKPTAWANISQLPLVVVSHIIIPIVIVAGFAGWSVAGSGSILSKVAMGSPWLALASLGLAVLFYITADLLFRWPGVRWAAAILLPLTLILVLLQAHIRSSASGIILMLLALAYLGVGYGLERIEGKKEGAWPLYAVAYGLAVFVTISAIDDMVNLVKVLFGDMILLAVSAAIHRDYRWVYAAAWFAMLPVYLLISLFVSPYHYQGLLMGVLGLNYCAIGYLLGRRSLFLGGPFLSAAAFLSAIVTLLTWGNSSVASLVLVVIAALYLLAALWLNWSWLLFPALLAANLAVLSTNLIFFHRISSLQNPLIISYFALGAVLILAGLWLRRSAVDRWAWPLYIVGGLDLFGAYFAVLLTGGWLAVIISILMATLLFAFAWLERKPFETLKIPWLFSYLGIGVVFVAHFYVLVLVSGERVDVVFPPITAAFCALFVGLSWAFRGEELWEMFGNPVRLSGLSLMAVPLVGAIAASDPVIVAVTFTIAGATYAVYGAIHRLISWFYLAIGVFLVVIWALLVALHITEPQAYVIPPGIAILGVAWYERLKLGGRLYRILSIVGLLLLLGSAFYQSFFQAQVAYAILLLIECLVFITLGIYTHSRCYVQLGGLALIANAIVQLGPGLIDLPRWVQIGLTGIILLGGGMAALFKREAILSGRQKLTEDWRQWNP